MVIEEAACDVYFPGAHIYFLPSTYFLNVM